MWSSLLILQIWAFLIVLTTGIRLPLEVWEQGTSGGRLGGPPSLRVRPERPQTPRRAMHRLTVPFKMLYQVGNSEEDLPACSPHAVCNKVDLYDESLPWVERQCRCPGHHVCKSNLSADDGHTLVDKTKHYKMCEPIKKLPKCRFFRDATWTLISSPDANVTEQIVHCHCPKNSVTYLLKKQSYETSSGHLGYQYAFACSPQSRLRCSRKEPCRLFTVRKRQEAVDEVNTSALCQCPRSHFCPRRHTSSGVLPGKTYTEEAIRTYSGYCMPTAPPPEPPLREK